MHTVATAPKPLSWTPRRHGDTYCAPACGRGCTQAEYDDAVKQAERLAARLGVGWTTRVWENLGWHWSVERGGVKIHAEVWHGRTTYTAFLGEKNDGGGWWAESARTPQTALRRVVQRAQAEIDMKGASLAEGRAFLAELGG